MAFKNIGRNLMDVVSKNIRNLADVKASLNPKPTVEPVDRSAMTGYRRMDEEDVRAMGLKKGGKVKMAKGGSASKRADGIAQRGKTRGKIV